MRKKKKYFVCPECGFKQKSGATVSIKCHRCGRSYDPKKALKMDKKELGDKKGFFKYSPEEKDD